MSFISRCRPFVVTILVLSLVLLVAALILHRQRPPMNGLTVPSRIDFGRVAPGRLVTEAEFANHSPIPIVIREILTDCGCTTAELKCPTQLKSGESISFSVFMDTTKKIGRVEKHIVVITDTPASSRHRITVCADVDGFISPTLIPSTLDFGRVGNWEHPIKELRIVYRGAGELRLTKPPAPPRGLGVTIVPDGNNQLRCRVAIESELRPGVLPHSFLVATTVGDVKVAISGSRYNDFYLSSDHLIVDGRDTPPYRSMMEINHSPSWPAESLAVKSAGHSVSITEIEKINSTKSHVHLLIAGTGAARDSFEFVCASGGSPIPVRYLVVGNSPAGEDASVSLTDTAN
jgi:hypothetical protein